MEDFLELLRRGLTEEFPEYLRRSGEGLRRGGEAAVNWLGSAGAKYLEDLGEFEAGRNPATGREPEGFGERLGVTASQIAQSLAGPVPGGMAAGLLAPKGAIGSGPTKNVSSLVGYESILDETKGVERFQAYGGRTGYRGFVEPRREQPKGMTPLFWDELSSLASPKKLKDIHEISTGMRVGDEFARILNPRLSKFAPGSEEYFAERVKGLRDLSAPFLVVGKQPTNEELGFAAITLAEKSGLSPTMLYKGLFDRVEGKYNPKAARIELSAYANDIPKTAAHEIGHALFGIRDMEAGADFSKKLLKNIGEEARWPQIEVELVKNALDYIPTVAAERVVPEWKLLNPNEKFDLAWQHKDIGTHFKPGTQASPEFAFQYKLRTDEMLANAVSSVILTPQYAELRMPHFVSLIKYMTADPAVAAVLRKSPYGLPFLLAGQSLMMGEGSDAE